MGWVVSWKLALQGGSQCASQVAAVKGQWGICDTAKAGKWALNMKTVRTGSK